MELREYLIVLGLCGFAPHIEMHMQFPILQPNPVHIS